MSFDAIFEERKVQACLEMHRTNPNMTLAEAARRTRASYDRARRRLRGIPASNSRGGHNKKFAEPQNEAIKDHLLFCHHFGRNAGLDHVIECANRLLNFDGILNPNGDIATVSRRWAERWMHQQRNWLTTLKSKPLSYLRRNAHNRQDIIDYFADFKRCKEKWGVLDEDIYNFDETGCQIGLAAGNRVIVPQGLERIFVNDPDNRELVTCVECFSATGYHVPPMLIFKGAYHLRKYFENDIDGDTLFARSESGFTNDVLAMAWIKHFEAFTRPKTISAYRILIFDGYGSHVTQDFLDFCWQHKIRPFLLPAHSTHLTQPADVGAFQKMKYEFKKELRKHVFLGGNSISKADFFAMFQSFSDRTWSVKLCKSAFRKTGLIPFNPNIVLDQMTKYGGLQEAQTLPLAQIEAEREPSSSPAFATPPPPPMNEYNTPATYTQRRRGVDWMDDKLENGPFPLTPTFKRVKSKVDKYTEREMHSGQLAKAHLTSVLAYQVSVKDKNDGPGTIVQKYGEIYGHQARRLIEWDDLEKDRVTNLIEERKKKAKAKAEEQERKRDEKEDIRASKAVLKSTK